MTNNDTLNNDTLNSDIRDTESRIQELKQISGESKITISRLNRIIAEYVTARDNEIKKEKQLQENINRLSVKLDKLNELKSSKTHDD